jgi:hypothetical protein
MPFAWAETLVQGVTIVKASHANELHINIDTIRKSIIDPGTGKAMPGYSWTRNPITKESDFILPKDFSEMQTALDEGYDKNVCITYNGAENKTHKGTDNATHDSTNNPAVNVGYDVSNLAPHYASDLKTHQAGVLNSDNRLVDNAYNSVNNPAANGAQKISNYVSDLAIVLFNDDNVYNGVVT